MNPLFEPATGDFRLTEDSPCIDAGDPANPPDPNGTIADQGALYYVAPTVAIDLTPHNPPILIPGSGGSFDFDVLIENITDSAVTFDVWTNVLLPDSSVVPILLRTNLSLPVGGSIMRTLTQSVPGGAPAGYYSYNGYVGFYPNVVMNDDYFNFLKLADDTRPSYNGGWTVSGWDGEFVQVSAPAEFSFSAYPNPFNPSATISYALLEAAQVTLTVYDVSGRQVAELVNGWRDAGVHEVVFDASNLTSGVYIYRIETDNFSAVMKMMLMK